MPTRPTISFSRWCAAVAAAAALAGPAAAGPLDPPVGPVAPTPGPNTATVINAQNTPGDTTANFIISQDGDYRLGANLNVADGRIAIKVTANKARINLSGFTINGTAPAGSNGDGIVVDITNPGGTQVAVEDGTITGFANGVNVVNAPDNAASRVNVDNTHVIQNDQNGVLVSGSFTRFRLFTFRADLSDNRGGAGLNAPNTPVNVQSTEANGNQTNGLIGGPDSYVDNTRANNNGVDGITIDGGRINRVETNANTGDGIDVSATSNFTFIEDFRAIGNGGSGAKGNGPNTSAENGVAALNGGNGTDEIDSVSGVQTPRNNQAGVKNTGPGARIRNVKSSGNGQTGFLLGDDAMMEFCSADGNADGAIVGDGANISNSSFSDNASTGLQAGENAIISQTQLNGNQVGLIAGDRANISNVTAKGPAPTGSAGVIAGQLSKIDSSIVSGFLSGITALGGTTISDTQVDTNGVGLEALGALRAEHNTFVNNTVGLRVGPMISKVAIIGNLFKSHTTGTAVQLQGLHNAVLQNTFIDNMTDVENMSTTNKVAPLQCDPTTAGPYDNWIY